MNRYDGFARHAFLGEIEHQASLGIMAAKRLPTSSASDIEPLAVWSAIQSLLIAAGNVSKILWPVGEKSAPRGEMLRQLLQVAHDSPLADRRFRNHFEHYDERLEAWLANRKSAVYTDQFIGSFASVPEGFASSVHRAYDVDTQTVSFRGEAIQLRPLVLALGELVLKTQRTTFV
jgi:hypothetical protein